MSSGLRDRTGGGARATQNPVRRADLHEESRSASRPPSRTRGRKTCPAASRARRCTSGRPASPAWRACAAWRRWRSCSPTSGSTPGSRSAAPPGPRSRGSTSAWRCSSCSPASCSPRPSPAPRSARRPWPSLARYVARRASRLLPAYWLVLVAVLVVLRPEAVRTPVDVLVQVGLLQTYDDYRLLLRPRAGLEPRYGGRVLRGAAADRAAAAQGRHRPAAALAARRARRVRRGVLRPRARRAAAGPAARAAVAARAPAVVLARRRPGRPHHPRRPGEPGRPGADRPGQQPGHLLGRSGRGLLAGLHAADRPARADAAHGERGGVPRAAVRPGGAAAARPRRGRPAGPGPSAGGAEEPAGGAARPRVVRAVPLARARAREGRGRPGPARTSTAATCSCWPRSSRSPSSLATASWLLVEKPLLLAVDRRLARGAQQG